MERQEFLEVLGATKADGSDGVPVRFELLYGRTAEGAPVVCVTVVPRGARTMGTMVAATASAATRVYTPSDATEDDQRVVAQAAQHVLRATDAAQLFLSGLDLLARRDAGLHGASSLVTTAERSVIGAINKHYKHDQPQVTAAAAAL